MGVDVVLDVYRMETNGTAAELDARKFAAIEQQQDGLRMPSELAPDLLRGQEFGYGQGTASNPDAEASNQRDRPDGQRRYLADLFVPPGLRGRRLQLGAQGLRWRRSCPATATQLRRTLPHRCRRVQPISPSSRPTFACRSSGKTCE
jgi:hypothetical protein